MVCDFDACVAWPSAPFVSLLSVSFGKAPPSILMANWILVSFVSRARAAERTLCSVFPAIVELMSEIVNNSSSIIHSDPGSYAVGEAFCRGELHDVRFTFLTTLQRQAPMITNNAHSWRTEE